MISIFLCTHLGSKVNLIYRPKSPSSVDLHASVVITCNYLAIAISYMYSSKRALVYEVKFVANLQMNLPYIASCINAHGGLEITVSHWPFSDQFFIIRLSKSNLPGQIYCTFPMGKLLIVYKNVLAFKEWLTNLKLF